MALRRKPRDEYDMVLAEAPEESVGHVIVQQLGVKGFCTINLMLDPSALKQAIQEKRELDASGRFYQPAFQIAEGLLGPEGSARIAELDPPGEGSSDGESLRNLDEKISQIGSSMMQADHIGLDISRRTNTIVHEAGAAEDDTPPLTERIVSKWLAQFQCHRVMAILFIGPSKGTLELRPHENDDTEPFEVRAVPGMLVLLRPDILSHKYFAPGPSIALSSFYLHTAKTRQMYGASLTSPTMTPVARLLDEWVLDRLQQIKEGETEESVWDPDIPRDWQRAMNHMFHKGQMIGITSCATRCPKFDDADTWFKSFSSGLDTVVAVPNSRWDHDAVYVSYDVDPEAWKGFKSYCKHGSFLDGIDLFDPKVFGMAPAEARGIDPHQRHILEVGYDALYRSGLRKKQLMSSFIGVYVGFGNLEWGMADKAMDTAFVATGAAASISSNRLSFCLGMKGPSMTIDTEGCASLTALYLAGEGIQKKGRGVMNTHSIAMGCHLILAPTHWPHHCAAGWLSKAGRCLTFDSSADGYVRCDATMATVLRLLENVDGETQKEKDEHLVGILAGAVMNHSGQNANLHAPNGPSHQECIAQAIKNAHISMLDVDMVEAHGQGDVLADAVEVGSLLRAHRSEMHKDPLGITAFKTAHGNMIEAASIAAFMKLVVGNSYGLMPPDKHLRQCNPHVDVVDTPGMLINELLETRMKSSFGGVFARGFGGTNVYAIAFGHVDTSKVSEHGVPPQPMLSFWPGGGGVMDAEMLPEKTYYIVGSFNRWGDPLPMERESDGTYAFNIILGENSFEQFQIWLDGNSEKVLHPGCQKAGKDAPVFGPSDGETANGLNWIIDGRGSIKETWVPAAKAIENNTTVSLRRDTDQLGNEFVLQQRIFPTADNGKPGDRYRVRLQMLGKWRMVNWKKVESLAISTRSDRSVPSEAGKYFIVGSWNDWSFQEMFMDEEGKFSLTFKLYRHGGEFQIVRDRDWFQVFYPATPDGTGEEYIVGPRDGGHGLNWFVDGKPGETYRIVFERKVSADRDQKKVSWTRL